MLLHVEMFRKLQLLSNLKQPTANFRAFNCKNLVQDVEKHTAEYTARFANPMVGAQRGFVDDIIDPKDTRRLICNDLRVLRTKCLENRPRKHSNIPL